MHESQCHELSSFITLTYDDDHLTDDLCYRDFQLFMKRLRKAHGYPVRFFMSGEYGEQFQRPHFHAVLFGIGFADRKYIGHSGSGFKVYRSRVLERLWPFGFSSVGDVSFQSAAYVARYAVKKVYGDTAFNHYAVVDKETGEVRLRTPEFCRMSLKPGIGALWYERHKRQVFPRDYVIINGVKQKPPRYYIRKLKKENDDVFAEVSYNRVCYANDVAWDNTPERLMVKEKVLAATVGFLKRELK